MFHWTRTEKSPTTPASAVHCQHLRKYWPTAVHSSSCRTWASRKAKFLQNFRLVRLPTLLQPLLALQLSSHLTAQRQPMQPQPWNQATFCCLRTFASILRKKANLLALRKTIRTTTPLRKRWRQNRKSSQKLWLHTPTFTLWTLSELLTAHTLQQQSSPTTSTLTARCLVCWWKKRFRLSITSWATSNVRSPQLWAAARFLPKSASSRTWWIRLTTWFFAAVWPTPSPKHRAATWATQSARKTNSTLLST